jgi:hypothetical protein
MPLRRRFMTDGEGKPNLAGNTARLWLGAKQLLARFLCYVLARGISEDALSW